MEKVELWLEPRQNIIPKLTRVSGEPEMSEFESGFLCGLLKMFRPRKVVEVGVAGGGTTAIIFQCLSMLTEKCDMYSVDISEKFYNDSKLETGFLANEAKQFISMDMVNHKFCLGKTLADYIDEIGSGIDFLILDTAHLLPGEILDWLLAFPYLAPGGWLYYMMWRVICLAQGSRLQPKYYLTVLLLKSTICLMK